MIFLLSSFSFHSLEFRSFNRFDKVVHFFVYGFLCFLLFRAFRGTFEKTSFLVIALWAWLVTVAYGASDEFHQRFTPFRNSDLYDLLVDGVGALVMLSVLFLKEKWRSDDTRRFL